MPSWSATMRHRRTVAQVMSASVASLSESRIIRDASDFCVDVSAVPRSCATFSVVTRINTLMALCVCISRGRQWKYCPLRLSRTLRPATPLRVAM